MKAERTNWEFHGFSSNPQKSYEAGKKGSVLATQASLKDATTAESKTASKVSNQNKPTQGKGWHSPKAGTNEAVKKKSSEE